MTLRRERGARARVRHILQFWGERECCLAGTSGPSTNLAVVDSIPGSLRGSEQPLFRGPCKNLGFPNPTLQPLGVTSTGSF